MIANPKPPPAIVLEFVIVEPVKVRLLPLSVTAPVYNCVPVVVTSAPKAAVPLTL